MGRKALITIMIAAVLLSTTVVSAGFFDSVSGSDLVVENISVSSEGYGSYELTCDLIPKTDYDYLQAFIVFYDSDDAVVEKSSLVWNTNNPSANQPIKVTGSAYVQGSNKPVRAEVFFSDALDADEKNAIFSENVTVA